MRNKWDMTKLGVVLSGWITSRGVGAHNALAEKMGTTPSQLTGWRQGRVMKPEQFLSLWRAAAGDGDLQRDLVCAQVLDHLPSELHQIVKVTVSGRECAGVIRDELESTAAAVPPDRRADVATLIRLALRLRSKPGKATK